MIGGLVVIVTVSLVVIGIAVSEVRYNRRMTKAHNGRMGRE